jgi:uncharacterized protein
VKEIEKEATRFGADIHTIELESQYHCLGSGNYISWLENILSNGKEPMKLEGDFDFRVVSSPHQELCKVFSYKSSSRDIYKYYFFTKQSWILYSYV